MTKIILLTAIAVLVALLYFYLPAKTQKRVLKIGDAVLQVEIAETFQRQVRGLSGREGLCENCGMLFVYSSPRIQAFWMAGMKFPLDFVFIRDGKVVEIVENVPVRTDDWITQIKSTQAADQVLEVNARFVEQNKIKVGDFIK